MQLLHHDSPSPAMVAWVVLLLASSAPAAAPVFSVDPFSASDATAGVAYSNSIAGAATDADGDTLVFAKVSGPAWLSVAPGGTLAGKPRAGDVGANSLRVSVSDGIEAPAEATLRIAVNAASGFVDVETPAGVLPDSGGADWQLTFTDEFNGIGLDTSKWGVDVSTQSRAARPTQGIDKWYWKPDNVSLDGVGSLVLDVVKHNATTMHCGSISSDGIYEPKYGYMEARIKIADTTKSTHTAFWLQSGNMIGSPPDDDSAADGAEVDVFESAWFGDYTKAVVHIDGYGAAKNANTRQFSTPGLHGGYHVFGLEWTSDSMKIYYDGVLKVTYTGSWVPQVTEWLWLSCGASFGDVGTFASEPLGWLTSAQVDYVRVWQKLPPTLASSDIVDDRGGASVAPGTLVTYTVTFSEDMDESTVTTSDFDNAGTAAASVDTVTEILPGVFSVGVTPTGSGSLRLRIPASAGLMDVAGNPLDNDPALMDDTTIIVSTPYESWSNGEFANPFTDKSPAGNPDGDSLSNLQEYAFGTDPTAFYSGSILHVPGADVTTPGAPGASNFAVGEGDDYRAVFGRRRDHGAAGLLYTVQFSAALDLWVESTDIPTVLTGEGSSGDIEAVSVPYPISVPTANGAGTPLFFRVGVSQAAP